MCMNGKRLEPFAQTRGKDAVFKSRNEQSVFQQSDAMHSTLREADPSEGNTFDKPKLGREGSDDDHSELSFRRESGDNSFQFSSDGDDGSVNQFQKKEPSAIPKQKQASDEHSSTVDLRHAPISTPMDFPSTFSNDENDDDNDASSIKSGSNRIDEPDDTPQKPSLQDDEKHEEQSQSAVPSHPFQNVKSDNEKSSKNYSNREDLSNVSVDRRTQMV